MKFLSLVMFLFWLFPLRLLPQNVNITTTSSENTQIAFPIGGTAGLKADKAENAGNSGAILGLQIAKKNKFFASILFNYADNKAVTGAQSQYGATVLNPSTEGKSFSTFGNLLLGEKSLFGLKGKYGLMWRAGVSFFDWEASISGKNETMAGQIGFGTFGLIICSEEKQYSQDNHFQIGGDFGLGLRKIMGQLGQHPEFRSSKEILGSDSTLFLGLEGTIFLRLNNLRPFIRVTYYFNKGIDCLSSFQAYLGIDLLSELFKGDLD